MDAGRLLGIGVAGSAILSGLLVGSAELYRKMSQPRVEQEPGEAGQGKEFGSEER